MDTANRREEPMNYGAIKNKGRSSESSLWQWGQQAMHALMENVVLPRYRRSQDRHYGPTAVTLEKSVPLRFFPLGFGSTEIAAGEESYVELKPQLHFHGERLAITPSVAQHFSILDIRVGKNSQLTSTDSLPGEVFSAAVESPGLELDTAFPGCVITLTVRNDSDEPRVFSGVLYGREVA
jgi:hypothetical protein